MSLHPLTLDVQQHHWVLLQERERLAQALDAAVLKLWPDLAGQLGPRVPSFVRAALEAAGQHGMLQHRHACGYLALWCVWGASFDAKPDFAWAKEIVSDATRSPAIKLQQLLLQTRIRLQQTGSSITPESWDAALAYLETVQKQPSVQSWIEQPGVDQEPRVLCDLQVLTVESMDQPWRKVYELQATAAGDLLAVQKTIGATQQQFCVDRPALGVAPLSMAVLACPPEDGVKAVLNVRAQLEHVCHSQQHPRMAVMHDAGEDVSYGDSLLRRPLFSATLSAQGSTEVPLPGLFAPVLPRHIQVQVQTCGLRLAGAPMREQCIDVSVWPATQWLADVRAYPQAPMQWPSSEPDALTRMPDLLLAADGQAWRTESWLQAWQGLVPQLRNGVEQWMRAVQRVPTLSHVRLAYTPNLMHGRSMVTWGMQEHVEADSSHALLRAQARGEWTACASDMQLQAQWHQEGAQARLKLHCAGQVVWKTDIDAGAQAQGSTLQAALAGSHVTWRFPWTVQLEAVSTPDLSMLRLEPLDGQGALCGEAGWRLREDGQGYVWYCHVRVEAMNVTMWVCDPLLGWQRTQHALWPASTLLDWSAG